jgi:hypothetical protein
MIDINFPPEYLDARKAAFVKTLGALRKWELDKMGKVGDNVGLFYPQEVEAFSIGYDAGFRARNNLESDLS